MKIFDEEKIKTYRNLEELVSSNVFVGRRDGLLLGIDERTIDELRNYMNKANMYDKQKEVLDKIKEKVNQYEFISGYYEYLDGEYWETDYDDDFKEEISKLLEEIE